MPLSIGLHSGDPFGQRNPDMAADCVGQVVGSHGGVRVAHAPELLGIAEVLGGDVVESLALANDVLLQRDKALRRRDDPAAEVLDRASVWPGQLRDFGGKVATGGWK